MNLPVPTITHVTLEQAVAAGCDCVMLKHDGWPVLINCIGEGCTILSAVTQNGVLRSTAPMSYKDIKRLEELDKTSPVEPLSALFVGARSRVTPMIYIYDMWWFDNQDIQMHAYRERYALARSNIRKLDERFKMVTVAPIQAAQTMWSDVAKDSDNLKGLVCRRSKDPAAGELYVIPYYKESPQALV